MVRRSSKLDFTGPVLMPTCARSQLPGNVRLTVLFTEEQKSVLTDSKLP